MSYFKKNRCRLVLEHLEDRLTPAFSAMGDGMGNVILTQTAIDGGATVTVGAGGAVTWQDNSVAAPFPAGTVANNLTINLMPNSGAASILYVNLNDPAVNGLTINASNGARTIAFNGTVNSIGGNLRVTTGTDSQTLNLANGTQFTAGGSAYIDLGSQGDTLLTGSGISVGTSLTLRGVNTYDNTGSTFMVGSLSVLNNTETEANTLALSGMPFIAGPLSYQGGSSTDSITLTNAFIQGNANINLGSVPNTGIPATSTQSVTVNGASFLGNGLSVTGSGFGINNVTVGGAANVSGMTNINFYSSIATNNFTFTSSGAMGGLSYLGGLGADSVALNAGGTVTGSVYMNMGDGTNNATIASLLGTNANITYYGGAGADSVNFNSAAGSARVRLMALLGAGNDTFSLNSQLLSYLYVNFGTGTKTMNGAPNGTYPYFIV